MKRCIEEKLEAWKSSQRRKPLIIRGARQVGKTWSIEKFGKTHYKAIYKIDFEKQLDAHAIFAGDLAIKKIIQQLEIIFDSRIDIENSLLFFDEIQSCPRALMSLRYFYEELPELHIIAAGSLLEFSLKDISFPVGRVQFFNMYPCTFYEFLNATNNKILAEELLKPPCRLPDTIHHKLLQELKTYFFVGGMPEAVKVYSATSSILAAFEVHSEIINSYRQDFAKYTPRVDRQCLENVLINLASAVGEQIKYSKLTAGFSNPTIHKAVDILQCARVINKIYSTIPGLPLGAGVNYKKFKATLIDIGLLQRLAQLPLQREIQESDLLAIFRGKLAEQFVGQEFIAANYGDDLFYWCRDVKNSSAEVDFIINSSGEIIPVEVKSGKSGTLKSMHILLKSYSNCSAGVVLYSGEYAELPEQQLTFIPLYYAATLFKN